MKVSMIVLSLAVLSVGSLSVLHAAESGGGDNEANEVKVPFAQLPAAVQKTLTREAEGVAIKTVDQETDHGKTAYEADAVIDGTNYEIVVAADGKLISKKIDDESKEGGKGKDQDKDQQGEHQDKD